VKTLWVFITFLPELFQVANRILDLLEEGYTRSEVKKDMKKVHEVIKEKNAIRKAEASNKLWNNSGD
jgi:cytochrome c-type biogenesis protein CcmE